MTFKEIYIAEAKGSLNAARNLEASGNLKQAAECYMKASNSYLEAAGQARNSEKTILKSFAETAASNAARLSNVEKEISQRDPSEKKDFVLAEIPKVSFNDVGGLQEVKEQIKKAIIYPFTHPEIYRFYGKMSGEGILMYGPPGCGKTLIAKATAHECGATFISVKTSDIVSRYVGEAEANVRQIFEQARESEKAIIFFDEIDSIAGNRDEAADYAQRTVNELLAQMDGVDSNMANILVIAATNIPWTVDPALMRPGRFSKKVLVPEPDFEARCEILRIHLKKKPTEKINIKKLAGITKGYSGAELKQFVENAVEAPLSEAINTGKKRNVIMKDFCNNIKPGSFAWYNRAQEKGWES